MRNVPKAVDSTGTLLFSLPCRPFVTPMTAVGGAGESAAGVRAAFVIRWDHRMVVRLRFTEAEWIAAGGVRQWLVRAQACVPFDWYPDQESPTKYTCYLIAPDLGAEIRPEPGEFPGTLELEITIRTAAGVPFDVTYWP